MRTAAVLNTFKPALEGVRFIVWTLVIMVALRTIAFGSNYIPSESMVPTLQIGDRLVVEKWAYGWSRYSLPFDPGFSLPTANGRIFSKLPERGDVVVFRNPVSGETYIKRVIGLPGDRIALRRGRLFVNGVEAKRKEISRYRYRDPTGGVVAVTRYEETIPGGRTHPIIERSDNGPADDMAPIVVPKNRLFMLGDNRDDSADSRFPGLGLVPVEDLKGRAVLISYSLYSCEKQPGLACAARRFMTWIR